MQVSEVPADRINGEIGAEGGAEPGNVGGRKQEIILADLNADFWITAQELRALPQVGGGDKVLAISYAAALGQV